MPKALNSRTHAASIPALARRLGKSPRTIEKLSTYEGAPGKTPNGYDVAAWAEWIDSRSKKLPKWQPAKDESKMDTAELSRYWIGVACRTLKLVIESGVERNELPKALCETMGLDPSHTLQDPKEWDLSALQ